MTPKQVCENQAKLQQESEQKKESEIKKSSGKEREIECKEKESERKNTSEDKKESKEKKTGENLREKEEKVKKKEGENKIVDSHDAGEDLRTNLFQEEGNDMNQETSSENQIQDPLQVIIGLVSEARAIKPNEVFNGLIFSNWMKSKMPWPKSKGSLSPRRSQKRVPRLGKPKSCNPSPRRHLITFSKGLDMRTHIFSKILCIQDSNSTYLEDTMEGYK